MSVTVALPPGSVIAPDKSKAPGQTAGFMEVVYEEDYIHKLNLK